jgi:hypothetical protein
VIVAETTAPEIEALDLVPAITSAVLEEQHLIVGVVVVVDPGTIPMNSRGEKQRTHLRELFLKDQLDPIYVSYNLWIDKIEAFYTIFLSSSHPKLPFAHSSSPIQKRPTNSHTQNNLMIFPKSLFPSQIQFFYCEKGKKYYFNKWKRIFKSKNKKCFWWWKAFLMDLNVDEWWIGLFWWMHHRNVENYQKILMRNKNVSVDDNFHNFTDLFIEGV